MCVSHLPIKFPFHNLCDNLCASSYSLSSHLSQAKVLRSSTHAAICCFSLS